MKPTIKKLKRRSLSLIKPRKLTKQDIYPKNEEMIEQADRNAPSPEPIDDKGSTEDENVHREAVKSTIQEIQTNSTVLSKQIKIVTQLNAKQIDRLISDRNTIKAHGLQSNMKFYDSFSADLVDIVYYQKESVILMKKWSYIQCLTKRRKRL